MARAPLLTFSGSGENLRDFQVVLTFLKLFLTMFQQRGMEISGQCHDKALEAQSCFSSAVIMAITLITFSFLFPSGCIYMQ